MTNFPPDPGVFARVAEALAMVEARRDRTPGWWRLTVVDGVGLGLGLVVGLAGAGPLIWLAAEARRAAHWELTPAGHFSSLELLLIWLGGAVIGGYMAAVLARALAVRAVLGHSRWPAHLLSLVVGGALVALLGPLLPCLLVALAGGHLDQLGAVYLCGGGLAGWQSPVVAFVFLYTFRVSAARRGLREVKS